MKFNLRRDAETGKIRRLAPSEFTENKAVFHQDHASHSLSIRKRLVKLYHSWRFTGYSIDMITDSLSLLLRPDQFTRKILPRPTPSRPVKSQPQVVPV